MPVNKYGIIMPAALAEPSGSTTTAGPSYFRSGMSRAIGVGGAPTPNRSGSMQMSGASSGRQQDDDDYDDGPASVSSQAPVSSGSKDTGSTPPVASKGKASSQPSASGERKGGAVPSAAIASDFSKDQFDELMGQIDGGDADQKAYAAMEMQTMALDSKSQMLMAQHGAILPLVKLLQPGDPMVQASAAGALWNLAANEQNKFAIAQSGAIQPLVAMLYSEVGDLPLPAPLLEMMPARRGSSAEHWRCDGKGHRLMPLCAC